MFIQTEQTPNPATLKFLPGRVVLESGTRDFPAIETAHASPLAEELFRIQGVAGVFLGSDFITVTKDDRFDWPVLKPMILAAIMDHFTAGRPMVVSADSEATTENAEADDEVVVQIKELIETRVRPAVAQDGGDIVFKGFEDGVVLLALKGSCAGCPSSIATLKSGIENMLKHYVPEVREVRQVA
jgi:Fe-S cluster biogenesis protein NfuA